MLNKSLLVAAIAVAISGPAIADHINNFNFKPLKESANAADWDATAPWKLPKGYTQTIVSDETALNIYPDGRDDWHDMNVVNETGPDAGRYMYRTHEVRLDTTPDNACEELILEEGGAVSVVDL